MLDLGIFDSIRIGLASPEQILDWSYGEVKKPETINYRTLKPELHGLFCERIFGPMRDWECHCGKYKRIRFRGMICDRCGVEVTRSKVRRDRMGHIQLAAPVSHIWYFKGVPSRMGMLLDLTQRNLERVLYFAAYIVIDPGDVPLLKKQLLTDSEYREYRERYGDAFQAKMGAEAIKELLAEIDIEEMAGELREEIRRVSGQRRAKTIKRLEVVEAFRQSGNMPEWMIIDVLPVVPPELRPMVQLEGGRFATSDLNDLYRRVINRNNRLKRLLDLGAPDIIVRNEKRMLQEAVDALIDNGRRGRPVTGPGNRPLKSLSDMLKGKQGRFRQNLLGKRVDYSGRSVIVVGPELKMHQCGLPKEMALELFKPFVMRKLVKGGQAHNIKSAKRMVERMRPEVWDVLEGVIREHPVLLNRAPTLHRLGIQAFEPVLSEGRAIKIHPLVCTAYNADFDGDQMAVHVPLSAEAQAEARVLMLASNNILSLKDGKPIVTPTQDMILGIFYLTVEKPGATGEGRRFTGYSEVLLAYEHGELDLQALIEVRMPEYGWVTTTPGRMIFNDVLPEEMKQFHCLDGKWHLGRRLSKGPLSEFVAECFRKLGPSRTAKVLDAVKTLGFSYACQAGFTIAVSDIKIPERKKEIIAAAEEKLGVVEKLFRSGLLSEGERYERVRKIWENATEEVKREIGPAMGEFNPVYMMATSGARGNINQLRQLAGMRGLMADPSGNIIEQPVKSNFREGLTVLEYFISTHGARKGLADTTLRTADSGYLTRRLVDVSQDIIIREADCDIVSINLRRERAKLAKTTAGALAALGDTLIGRVVAVDVLHPETNDVLLPQGIMLNENDLDVLSDAKVTEIQVRGVSRAGDEGGSVAAIELISLGQPRESVRRQLKAAIIREMLGKEIVEDVVDGRGEVYLPAGTMLNEKEIEKVLAGDVGEMRVRNNSIRGIVISRGDITDEKGRPLLSFSDRILGRVAAENIIDPESGELLCGVNEEITEQNVGRIDKVSDAVLVRSVLTCKSQFGVCARCYGRNLANNRLVDVGEAVGIIAAQSIGEPGTQLTMRTFHTGGVASAQDITQGLPRVEELFEARKPKRPAVLSETSGRLEIRVDGDTEKIAVISDSGQERVYDRPHKSRLTRRIDSWYEACKRAYNRGEQLPEPIYVETGERLTEGAVNPHDILRIKGVRETQSYIVNSVLREYKDQGVEINDKHIEVMVRQMLHKVKIEDSGDTDLLIGDYVDINVFEQTNVRMLETGRQPAVANPVLLGITKASLATDSFLSAASFQETTKVLTEAAIKGKIDPLLGLKENVIIGKLVPAGTGMARYSGIRPVTAVKPAGSGCDL
ncbi:MAG: DNA-directed RNA polymerase subunit beta' [Negativicutes bacterium]|nr:DNA-directed RNA polymerase subunit beta' [Negativicutes bacterium]